MGSSTTSNSAGGERICTDRLLDLITSAVVRGALATTHGDRASFYGDLARALFELKQRREHEQNRAVPPLVCLLMQGCSSFLENLEGAARLSDDGRTHTEMQSRAQTLRRLLQKALDAHCKRDFERARPD